MSLLFITLSRFVITCLPNSKQLLISWVQSPSAVILEPKKIKTVTASTFSPSIYHDVIGLDAMILVIWGLSFKPLFSLSLTLIKRLFSSSSLSAFTLVSSAYLRLLIFLLAILIPACDSSSLAFCVMYSAYNHYWELVKPRKALYCALLMQTTHQMLLLLFIDFFFLIYMSNFLRLSNLWKFGRRFPQNACLMCIVNFIILLLLELLTFRLGTLEKQVPVLF